MYGRKSRGPSAEPYGTPDRIGIFDDCTIYRGRKCSLNKMFVETRCF